MDTRFSPILCGVPQPVSWRSFEGFCGLEKLPPTEHLPRFLFLGPGSLSHGLGSNQPLCAKPSELRQPSPPCEANDALATRLHAMVKPRTSLGVKRRVRKSRTQFKIGTLPLCTAACRTGVLFPPSSPGVIITMSFTLWTPRRNNLGGIALGPTCSGSMPTCVAAP